MSHTHPRDNSLWCNDILRSDPAESSDHDQPLAASAPTTPYENPHLQSREMILALIMCIFVLLAALITASMVVFQFLMKLSTLSVGIVNEFKRRM